MEYSGYDGLSTLTTGHCTHSACSDTAHPLLQLRQVSLCHRQTLRSVTSSQPSPNIVVCHVKSATAKHCCLSRQVSHRQTLLFVTSSQPPPNIAVCHVKSATAKHCCLSRLSQPPSNIAVCHVKSATARHCGLSSQPPSNTLSVTSSQPFSKNAATQSDQRSRSDTNTRAQVCHCH